MRKPNLLSLLRLRPMKTRDQQTKRMKIADKGSGLLMLWDFSKFTNFKSYYFPRQDYLNKLMSNMGFVLLGEGRHRRVYRSKNLRYVLKFPMNSAGLSANREEQSLYKTNKEHYAPCRMVDEFVLMMRYVKPVKVSKEVRDQFPWMETIDNHQIGMMANKKLVAYDYAG